MYVLVSNNKDLEVHATLAVAKRAWLRLVRGLPLEVDLVILDEAPGGSRRPLYRRQPGSMAMLFIP